MVAKGITKKFVPAKSWCTRAGESANQTRRIAEATYHQRAPDAEEETKDRGPYPERVRVSTPLLRMATRIDPAALIRAPEIVSLIEPPPPGGKGCVRKTEYPQSQRFDPLSGLMVGEKANKGVVGKDAECLERQTGRAGFHENLPPVSDSSATLF